MRKRTDHSKKQETKLGGKKKPRPEKPSRGAGPPKRFRFEATNTGKKKRGGGKGFHSQRRLWAGP